MPSINSHFNGIDYVCECGRHFLSFRSLSSHARFCSLYKKESKKTKYWHNNILQYICECLYLTTNHQSLNAHFRLCDIHHKALYNESLNERNKIPKGCMNGWNTKTEKELNDIHKKAGLSLSEHIENGLVIPSFLGKHHTEDTKQKLRIKMLNNIKERKGKVRANYSIKACNYIDLLNEKNSWNLLHALNAGEYFIDGYFLDGYDKDLNIAFEYDEPKHYKDIENNILKEKDLIRLNNIINKLCCEFWRYNEYCNCLYKIV